MNPGCAVCGQPAAPQPLIAAPGPAVCDAAACRLVMDRQRAMSPLASKSYLESQSRLHRERLAQARHQEAFQRERALAEDAENSLRWAQAEASLQGAGRLPPHSERLALPSGPRRTSPLPAGKRRRYREHLSQLIAAALAPDGYADTTYADEPSDPPGEAAALRGHLCAACGGGCCAQGGCTAYLTVPMMRRFMARHPKLGPGEVLAAYLDRLSPRTVSGSCINHAAGGCSLPREMRSDTCNRFLCPPLQRLRARQAEPDPPRAVVVLLRRQDAWNQQREGRPNDIVGGALVTPGGIKPLG